MLEILSGLKQGELLGHLLASAGACIPSADSGIVAVAEDGGGSLTLGASYGLEVGEAGEASWLKSLSSRGVTLTVSTTDASSPDNPAAVNVAPLPGGRRSMVAADLGGDGKRQGFIALFSIFPEAFTARDSDALARFGVVASLAVRDAGLHAQISALAVSDSLTGLLNRKGFNELAEREFKRAARFGDPLAVLRIELEGLKSINDTYGRSVGDQLLRGLGRRLQLQLRAVDLIGRCAPGTFYVMLAETTAGKATWVLSRIRRALMDVPYETRRGEMKVAITAGSASTERGCADVAQLMEWADSDWLARA
jgi:diguanylate cyclase (GGDEF)-like protein